MGSGSKEAIAHALTIDDHLTLRARSSGPFSLLGRYYSRLIRLRYHALSPLRYHALSPAGLFNPRTDLEFHPIVKFVGVEYGFSA